MVNYPDGKKKLVVTGGHETVGDTYHNSTQILDLETLEWAPATDLPYTIAYGSSVPFKDTFLVVGGEDDVNYQTAIYQFDLTTNGWITRDEQLVTGRRLFASFLVPDNAVNCS